MVMTHIGKTTPSDKVEQPIIARRDEEVNCTFWALFIYVSIQIQFQSFWFLSHHWTNFANTARV